ncbi:HD-domain/PDEase-like protein [Piromyces finnis]|uniref:Phosphodiesterase n=1 Tax=Piromyces finnis TaxID=1754191 RepID=A0A1Y1VKG1_9FUNG|nr:HD-domain/PDEase-like protein [Piromyces finnis]|eukprot:ORX58572.1 HD-domain/PDEase-like protein [Piromyces finnis]
MDDTSNIYEYKKSEYSQINIIEKEENVDKKTKNFSNVDNNNGIEIKKKKKDEDIYTICSVYDINERVSGYLGQRFKDNPIYYYKQCYMTGILIHVIVFGMTILAKQLLYLELEDFYLFVLYITISTIIVGEFRIFFEFNPKSPIPYYTLTIPFIILSLVFKENNLLFETLYYISLSFLIYLSEIPNKAIHLKIIPIVFFVYFTATVLLRYFFEDNMCQRNRFATELCDKKEELSKIDLWDEFFLIITILFLVELISRFQYYIDYGKYINIRRENALGELFQINKKLRKNINTLNRYKHLSENTLYSDIPIKELIELMIKIKETPKLNNRYKQYISFLIRLLEQNISYSKNSLNYEDRGQEIKEIQIWLDLLEVKKQNKIFNLFTNKEIEDYSKNIIDEFPEEVMKYLKRYYLDMHYNAMKLHQLSEGHSLFYTVLWLVTIKYDLLNKLNIKKALFYEWVINIESGYKKNPYHNSMHAADVLFMTHYLIVKSGIIKKLTPIEIFSVIIASFIHDFKHPGVNNNFLIETSDELAILYNDSSVLENYHIASSFLLMDQFNFIVEMDDEMKDYMKEIIISMVLATDMFYNTYWTKKFADKVENNNIDFSCKEDKLLLLNIFIKCADVGNPVKPLDIYVHWVKMIIEEFFQQGDEEAKRGMIISPYMDRNFENTPDNQIGFISFVVNPLFIPLNKYFDGTFSNLLINIDQNLEYWKIKKQQRIQKEEEQRNKKIAYKNKILKSMKEKRLSQLEDDSFDINKYQCYQNNDVKNKNKSNIILNKKEMKDIIKESNNFEKTNANNINNNNIEINPRTYVNIRNSDNEEMLMQENQTYNQYLDDDSSNSWRHSKHRSRTHSHHHSHSKVQSSQKEVLSHHHVHSSSCSHHRNHSHKHSRPDFKYHIDTSHSKQNKERKKEKLDDNTNILSSNKKKNASSEINNKKGKEFITELSTSVSENSDLYSNDYEKDTESLTESCDYSRENLITNTEIIISTKRNDNNKKKKKRKEKIYAHSVSSSNSSLSKGDEDPTSLRISIKNASFISKDSKINREPGQLRNALNELSKNNIVRTKSENNSTVKLMSRKEELVKKALREIEMKKLQQTLN